MGRLTADPEYRQTPQGIPVCTFRIAVDRPYSSNRNNNPNESTADFFKVTAWRNQADFVSRYFSKGKPIIVEGSIRNENYTDQNNVNHYSVNIQAEKVSFCLTDNRNNNMNGYGGYQQQGGYANNNGYSNNGGYQGSYGNNYNQGGGYVPQGNNNYFQQQPQQPQQQVPYQQSSSVPMQQPSVPIQVQENNASATDSNQNLQVGQLDDFEEILSDNDVPF